MAGPQTLEDGARGSVPTVFVSDPTAEAERAAQALRAAGYTVADVPLAMLVARVAVQEPRVVLIDADTDGALDVVVRMRQLPGAGGIHVVFLARPGGAFARREEALSHEGSGLFVRPVDMCALVRKIDALTGGAQAAAHETVRLGAESKRPSVPPSLPPASMRTSTVPPSDRPPSSDPKGLMPPVSAELQHLLAEAEQRVQVWPDSEAFVPSPEEEIEAVLPAELLAALDEPLGEEEEEEDVLPRSRPASGRPGPRERTIDGGAPRTTGASTTGSGATPHETRRPPRPVTNEQSLTPPLARTGEQASLGTQSGATGAGPSTGGGSESNDRDDLPPATVSPSAASFPAVVGPGDAVHLAARAIAARTTGSVCLAADDIERRLVLREGDVVTCVSTAEEESLLAFLGVRGDLPRETVRRLASKFPAYGRHAGAALVARGYLRQGQMWPTLRAHAEWVLGLWLQTAEARLSLEAEPPGRLAGEPGVFGGTTGAAVLVDIVRRTVSAAEATERLGGPAARVAEGPAAPLLVECGLAAPELEQVREAPGRTLRGVLGAAPGADLAAVVFALVQLGVLEMLPAIDGAAAREEASADGLAIDADATRERVRARLQLVEDGDYFAVLGVAHAATGYEIRRAFLDLRRAFDPSRLLTPEVADLADAARKIVGVLEEAYEILKDEARRDRYRRAIEAVPEA